MTWNQNTPADYMHGMTADLKYLAVNQNHAHLYGNYEVPFVFGTNLELAVTSSTMTDVLKFWVPKNLDNNPLKIYARVKITGGNDDGLVKLIETTTSTGSAATIADGQTDVTELANPFDTITLTPTGTADGREFKLQAKVKNTGDTMKIHSLMGVYAGTGAVDDTGIGASGFRTTNASIVYQATGPINTEHISALINGPKQIAKDRTACVASILGDVRARAAVNTTSVDWVTVDRGMFPAQDYTGDGRNYKMFVNLGEEGGATPHLRILFPNANVDPAVSGTGWSSDTFKITNMNKSAPRWVEYSIQMKRVGGTAASLQSFQLFRSP